MCGIAGIIGKADEGLIQSMTRVLAHRGPDGEGYYLDQGVALGHRRLSIIDLETGQQPMTSADGRYTIVFNGEIYNFLELRRELESRGVRLRTRSDTEVLLEAYATWGRDALAKLRGMFAFAIWDKRERSLFAARDRLGVKPFYYAQIASQFLFASEMKSLLAYPGFERKLNYPALDDYLTYLYVPPPETIFQGIFELPPAHWLEWENCNLRLCEYWDVNFAGEKNASKQIVKETQEVLDDAVAARLISDVPLGVFLSGGIDSSTIARLMANHLSEPVRAFTLKFQEGGRWYSETEFAREVSEAIGAESRELEIVSKSAELLGTVTRHFDEPFGNPTALLLYQLSEAARQHVTVALVGDAGDEVRGGIRGAGKGRTVDHQGGILAVDAIVVIQRAGGVGAGGYVCVGQRRCDGQLPGLAGGTRDEAQPGARGVGEHIGGESEIRRVDGGGNVGQSVIPAAGIDGVRGRLRWRRADHDGFGCPVPQLDGHRAGERIGGIGDRVEVAARGLSEVVHHHRVRACRRRRGGRRQLKHAGVGARSFLLR